MNGINDNDSEVIKRKFFDFFGDIAIVRHIGSQNDMHSTQNIEKMSSSMS